MKTTNLRLVLAGCFLLGTGVSVLAAPQTFNTALPVAQGEFVFRQQFFNKKAIVQIPVFQNLNGTALKDNYTFRTGFRVNF